MGGDQIDGDEIHGDQIHGDPVTRPAVSRIDRLQRLAVFEAAARLGSFSAAGRELGLAQPAVTRHIQALERSIGLDLFERQSNRSALSAAGVTFAASVDAAFTTLEVALHELTSGDGVFVLAMPPGFAQQLVVPHLDALQRALGDRDLRLWLYDREHELAGGHFDAAVRVASSAWKGFESITLFPEAVMPVATPMLATRLRLAEFGPAAALLDAPLLHMDAADRPWMSWTDWFAEFDLALPPGLRRVEFNNYPTVLQQALAGRGVALGWSGLVDELVDDGLLQVVGPTVTTDRNYSLNWPTRRSGSAMDAVRNCMIAIATRTAPE